MAASTYHLSLGTSTSISLVVYTILGTGLDSSSCMEALASDMGSDMGSDPLAMGLELSKCLSTGVKETEQRTQAFLQEVAIPFLEYR